MPSTPNSSTRSSSRRNSGSEEIYLLANQWRISHLQEQIDKLEKQREKRQEQCHKLEEDGVAKHKTEWQSKQIGLAYLDGRLDEKKEELRFRSLLEEKAAKADSGLAKEIPRTEFNPNHYGGKELAIVVSYAKAGNKENARLAKILKNKAGIKYSRGNHSEPFAWYRKNPEGFSNHLYKLRKKAKDNEWWDLIPTKYYLSYL